MKKTTLILLLLLAGNLRAQYAACSFNDHEFESFLKTKLMVVLSGDDEFDKQLRECMPNYWKFGAYDFITVADYERERNNEQLSFLQLFEIEDIVTKSYSNGRTYTERYYYYVFGILTGGKKAMKKFSYTDMIAYCPLDYYGDEKPMAKSAWRLPLMISSLNETVNLVKEKEIKGNSLRMVVRLNEIYNEKAAKLKEKTLLVNRNYLKNITEEEFKELYPFKVEFCDEARLKAVQDSKDKKYAIFIQARSQNKSMVVYDAATFECIYGNIDVNNKALSKNDVKELRSRIGK